MINKSFQILRTNPLLTTNVKLVVTSKYKLYLESFDSNKQLSDTKYKHIVVNKDKYLEDVISEFYTGLPVNIAYDAYYDEDNNIMYNNFDHQFDDIYYAGAKNIEDQWYSEEFEYFAPLYIKPSDLPSNFIILRVDEPAIYKRNGERYRIESLSVNNFTDEILNKWKCVTLFDLTKNSDLGGFLNNNYVENSRFPNKSFELDIKKSNFSRWYGMDFESGIYTEKSQILDDKLYYETPDFNLEQRITNGYRDNKLIFPNILNLKFLFDDTPADANVLKKWSMNRYYGFYTDSLENVENLTSYVTPKLRSNIKLVNNIFIKVGTAKENINPFINGWDETDVYFIYIDNNLHKVERVLTNGSYMYKVISDTNLDSLFSGNTVYDNTVNINYDSATGRNYIQNIAGDLKIDEYVNRAGNTDVMYADLYLIEINGIYHVLKHDSTGYYIQTDYVINSNQYYLEYWIGGKTSDYYKKIDVYNKKNKNQLPLIYKVYRVKFSDIKDFDFDRVNTHYSDFDYEKSTYYTTEEFKLNATEYRDLSNPKSKKVYGVGMDGQYKVINVSSEYVASDELFEIKNNNLTDIWKKNQTICKWGYQDSNSHCDYPYKLNNSLKTGSEFNRTVNPYAIYPNTADKNLDYFYRIGNFHDDSMNKVYYYNQSTNIQTDLLDQSHSSKFNLDLYIKSDVDYFTYFFSNKEYYYDFGKLYQRQYQKYSIFNSGDKYENSSTLFKGLKVNINAVDNFILTNDTHNKISEVLTNDSKRFNGYKFSIFLNDRYRTVNGGTYWNNSVTSSSVLKNPDLNGIHVFLNDKYKNVLIVLNINMATNYLYDDLNNVNTFGEKHGLYYAKKLTGADMYTGADPKIYNPSLITAHNFIEALNNMNDTHGFDSYINFYYVDESGVSGSTTITDYTGSTLSNISSWGKKVPPFILDIEYPNLLELKKNSYDYVPISGPEYNIYDKYKTNAADKLTRSSDIDDYLAREININESEIPPMVQQHNENIQYTNSIYRYSGSYEPIFKNIQLFNTPDVWTGSTYYKDKNYSFDLSLKCFGQIEEIQFSKVNRKTNLLRLKDVENDKSIYPMVDEFGYSNTSRFIFKSGWDSDYFIESVEPKTSTYDVSALVLTLNMTKSNVDPDPLKGVIYNYTIKNSNAIVRNVILDFSYTNPSDGVGNNPPAPIPITIAGNTTYTGDTSANLIDLTGGSGVYEFHIKVSPTEYADAIYNVPVPLPWVQFLPDSSSITAGNSVNFTWTGTGATSYLWTFAGGSPSSSSSANPTITYKTTNGSPFSVSLTAYNSAGGSSTKSGYITVTAAPVGPVAHFNKVYTETGILTEFIYNGETAGVTNYEWVVEHRGSHGAGASTYTTYTGAGYSTIEATWAWAGNYSISVRAYNGVWGAVYFLADGVTVYPADPPSAANISFTMSKTTFFYTGGTCHVTDMSTPAMTTSNREWYYDGGYEGNASSMDIAIDNNASSSPVTYSIKLRNADTNESLTQTVTVEGKPPYCLSVNTPIPLANGTWKKLGDVIVGDELKTFYIDGVVDESENGWFNWTTESLIATMNKTKVVETKRFILPNYFILNNKIEVGSGHKFFIKKKYTNVWGWCNIENIEIGDYLYDMKKKEIVVTSIIFIEDRLEVVKLNVEDLDGFFADTYFVHNKK